MVSLIIDQAAPRRFFDGRLRRQPKSTRARAKIPPDDKIEPLNHKEHEGLAKFAMKPAMGT
jgi:hypothetical protein